MAKPILDNTRAEQSIAEPKTNCDEKFELCKELLSELRNNAYNRRVEEDVIDHITKILEILDLVKIANVDPFQLRVKAFPLSLAGEARKWWMNEGYRKINTWEELVKKFFGKFYPVSCANNYDKMSDDEEGRDSLEFIILMNSKFNDHKKVDETIKRALLHSWIEVGKNEGIMNDIVSSNEEWEEHEYGNPPNTNDDSFLEPYLDAHKYKSIKRPPAEDDECYGIDYLDTTIHSKIQELLEDDQLDSFLVNNLKKSIDQSDLESCGEADDGSETETPIQRIEQVNTPYSELQGTKGTEKTQNEHLYSASANEINEKRP
ncbi:hypothetical protein Tco_0256323 [Tanacetum coccineum]